MTPHLTWARPFQLPTALHASIGSVTEVYKPSPSCEEIWLHRGQASGSKNRETARERAVERKRRVGRRDGPHRQKQAHTRNAVVPPSSLCRVTRGLWGLVICLLVPTRGLCLSVFGSPCDSPRGHGQTSRWLN